MSTINKTTNFGLTTYVGIKNPLFLNDHSHDMEIIDALISQGIVSANKLKDVHGIER